jgi:hypothetical protein
MFINNAKSIILKDKILLIVLYKLTYTIYFIYYSFLKCIKLYFYSPLLHSFGKWNLLLTVFLFELKLLIRSFRLSLTTHQERFINFILKWNYMILLNVAANTQIKVTDFYESNKVLSINNGFFSKGCFFIKYLFIL